MKRVAALLMWFALGTVPAWAQSTDLMYGGWMATPQSASARSLGAGGSVVALADDSSTVFSNPAGIVRLPKTELSASFLGVQKGLGPGVATTSAWTGPAFVGGAGRLGSRFGIGGYLAQSFGGDLAVATRVGDESVSTLLERKVVEGGAAAAYEVRPGFSVGLRVTASHLTLQGLTTTPRLNVGTSAGQTRVTGSLGVLYAQEGWGLGLSLQPGSSFTPDRTANDGTGAPLDPGSEYEVRIPSALAIGGSLQATRRLRLLGQIDFVRYGEISHALVDRPGAAPVAEFSLDDAVEPRAGLEFAFPFSGASLVLRGGVRSIAPAALRYRGRSPAELAVFPGSGRTTVTAAGATLETKAGWYVDLGGEFGGVTDVWSGGLRFRF